MEITWNYDFLETVGFLILFFFAAFLVVRGTLTLWLWLGDYVIKILKVNYDERVL